MNKHVDVNRAAPDDETGKILLRTVQRFNWLLLVALIAGSWSFFSWTVAQSVLIGGILVNVSFILLRRDIHHLMARVSAAGLNVRAVQKIEKIKFLLKFYGRLATLAAVIYLLATLVPMNMIGLAIGLSTVMLSVIIVVLGKGRTIYSVQSLKGA